MIESSNMSENRFETNSFTSGYLSSLSGPSTDSWRKSGTSSPVHFPPIKCSKYTVIGDPSMAKRRRRKRKDDHRNFWSMPDLNNTVKNKKKSNPMEDNGIYGKKVRSLYNTVVKPTTPKEKSFPTVVKPGVGVVTDGQLLKEKAIVMKDIFSTGRMGNFARDRVVIPTVYPDVLKTKGRKKKYIRDSFTDFVRKGGTKVGLMCSGRDRNESDERCNFCDVMGNKYCSNCIESKTRTFARNYENRYWDYM